jgi:hypothetical protein
MVAVPGGLVPKSTTSGLNEMAKEVVAASGCRMTLLPE